MQNYEGTKKQFYSGDLSDGYKFFGCQYKRGSDKATFRVWAPRAKQVSVVGEFNDWKVEKGIMQNEDGIWSVELCGVKELDGYKYHITTADGREIYKSDPYAFHSEYGILTNSKVYDITGYQFTDDKWMKTRSQVFDKPVNIYEAHIGSWRRYADGNCFDYRKFADEITDYLSQMNYTHIELMGIAEYPYDGSWGYQITGYYAPTSRYGLPEGFCYLVDKLHNAGIGVILDWVPGHFPKDANGLYEFDGEPLYEPFDVLMREHKEWGTRCFDYENGAVKSFLISNAMYWLDVFHVDGLRVDAVASMLYLDYSRNEWRPNKYGGKENLGAIEFFKSLNSKIFERHPSALMIAEESTAFPLVTMPVSEGGLGFNFKWNMGWMNDTLSYAKTDPLFRSGKHHQMTFSMFYAFSENYILPISHDEVVHGKGSLVNKMPLEYEQKLAGFRNYLMYMFSHPGKKLTFMGTDIAQFTEWNYAKEMDWSLLQFDAHKNAQSFVKTLNGIYKDNAPLWEIEKSWDGFEWLVPDDNMQSVLVYERLDKQKNRLLVVLNFTPCKYENYRFGIESGSFKEILNSNVNGFSTDNIVHKTQNVSSHDKKSSMVLDIMPLSGIYMVCKAKKKKSKSSGAVAVVKKTEQKQKPKTATTASLEKPKTEQKSKPKSTTASKSTGSRTGTKTNATK